MLKAKGYELKMSVMEFLGKIRDAIQENEYLKSSKTDKKTDVTTNTYKDGQDKWTLKLDKDGREIGGTFIDGTEFVTTYDDESGTFTRSYNGINKVYDSASMKMVQYKKGDEVVCNVKYGSNGSYEHIYSDNSKKVFDKNGICPKSYYANGQLKSELYQQSISWLELFMPMVNRLKQNIGHMYPSINYIMSKADPVA